MSVQEKSSAQRYADSKSGIMDRDKILGSKNHHEPEQPTTLPEAKEQGGGATTGALPAVIEGQDASAIGDADSVKGG